MTDYDKLLATHKTIFKKALSHLKYSFERIQKLSTTISELSEQELTDWESFIARFSRASDLFIAKYLRTYIEKQDPAFKGSLRDFLNLAEKYDLIDSAYEWLDVREFRNRAAHDYDDEKLEENFKKIRELTPIVLNVEKKLK